MSEMNERIVSYFLTEPRRLKTLGGFVTGLGTMIILAGLLARVATASTAAIGSLAGHQVLPKTLADIYPSLPTWWVPESVSGGIVAIFIVAVGVGLSLIAKRLQRLLGEA